MGKHAIHKYATFNDLIAESAKPRYRGASSSSTDDSFGHSPWHGTQTYAEAVELARSGWSENRPLVEQIADKVRPQIREHVAMRPKVRYDVAGSSVNVGRMLSGDPRAMRRRVKQPTSTHGPIVTILVDVCVSASIDPEQIVARGAAVVALIECLQTQFGHTVELWFEDTACSDYLRDQESDKSTRLVCIKPAGSTIDSDDLMYIMAHPSMFRRHCFAARERCAGWESFAGRSGYGYPPQGPLCGDVIGADLTINKPMHGEKAITDPAEWVIEALKGLGLWQGD